MRPFAPESRMYTLGGVFYPTGHIFLMYPTQAEAIEAEQLLIRAGVDGGTICLLTPTDVHEKIAALLARDEGLPSPGTEAETARHYEALALSGHYGLLVPASRGRDAERVMEALRGTNISYAQRYRHFVIEELVP